MKQTRAQRFSDTGTDTQHDLSQKGTVMSIKLRHLTSFLIAGAAATAIAAAPAASAATVGSPTCRDAGNASVCQKQGHASISAEPRNSGNQPLSGPGQLSLAQLWALG